MQKGRIPHLDSALAKRLREAIGDESVVSFGRRCGLNESTLRKYFYGTLPNIENIISIADAANVNIEWLAAGRGPKKRGESIENKDIPKQTHDPPAGFNDQERLHQAIKICVEALPVRPTETLNPPKLAQLITVAYELLTNKYQPENIAKIIKLSS